MGFQVFGERAETLESPFQEVFYGLVTEYIVCVCVCVCLQDRVCVLKWESDWLCGRECICLYVRVCLYVYVCMCMSVCMSVCVCVREWVCWFEK